MLEQQERNGILIHYLSEGQQEVCLQKDAGMVMSDRRQNTQMLLKLDEVLRLGRWLASRSLFFASQVRAVVSSRSMKEKTLQLNCLLRTLNQQFLDNFQALYLLKY